MSSRRKSVPASDKPLAPLALLDRDHSLVAFNQRVLSWAKREGVPVLEKLRYICIVSSNLDELFEVRLMSHLQGFREQLSTPPYSAESFLSLMTNIQALVAEEYRIYNEELTPELARHRIEIVSHNRRSLAQKKWVAQYFEEQVRPLLVPVALDPAHPFPQVANKSLNFVVRLSGRDAFGRENDIAIVKVPRVLPRFVRLPPRLSGQRSLLVSLSSVLRAHLKELFSGRRVEEFSQFRVTRHSDLAVDEDDAKDLRMALRQGLEQRHYGAAVRLEVSSGCSLSLERLLLSQFDLPAEACFRVPGPVNLVRLSQVIDLTQQPKLLFAPHRPARPHQFKPHVSLFEQISQRDRVVHQPYESFDAVLAFLREAVDDPDVLAIKQSLYRTGTDSEIMRLLRQAVINGKEVSVVVELKARFDEEANIYCAEQLEAIGAQVVYGVMGLKTHAKMLLVTRREGKLLRRYVHLATGNYNSRTAKLYTDIGYFSADSKLTLEVEQVFVHLASQGTVPKLDNLWLAPFELHSRLLAAIAAVAQAAAAGEPARMVLKMNSLTDDTLARALMAAAAQGASIDVIVRGACVLPVAAVEHNIRVHSVIGRFLEHSRVWFFEAGAEQSLYLSSADWMNRNMFRRIELAWPVRDAQLRQELFELCLKSYLNDDTDAWQLQADGSYHSRQGPGPSAQNHLAHHYAALSQPLVEELESGAE